MNIPAVQCDLRCANLACAHEWTALPNRDGITTISDCPKCNHSSCVVLKWGTYRWPPKPDPVSVESHAVRAPGEKVNPYQENPKLRVKRGGTYLDRDGGKWFCVREEVGTDNVQRAELARDDVSNDRGTYLQSFHDGMQRRDGQDRGPWLVEEVVSVSSSPVESEASTRRFARNTYEWIARQCSCVDVEEHVVERLYEVFRHYIRQGQQCPVSSETVACDRPPYGWVCTRARGHEGSCAAIPHPIVLEPQTPAQRMGFDRPEPYTRDRFNPRASAVMAKPSFDGVVKALKEVFWEGHGAGRRDAKAEWGEAVEETDKTRAFRIVDSLFGDGLISTDGRQGSRAELEERIAEALAEVRAIAAQPKPTRENPFLDELEKHRTAVHDIARSDHGNTLVDRRVRTLTDAVWLLLAVAHQP